MPRSHITPASGVGSRRSTALVLVVTLLVTAAPLRAQPVAPADWSIVDAQPAGVALVVELTGGEELTGTLVRVGDIDLEVALSQGRTRAVPKSAVVEVRTQARVGDPLRNGMTYGGLIGAAAMGAFVGFLFSVCEANCDAPHVATVLLPALALGAGGGIGAGAAVDAAIRRPLVLYHTRRRR